MCQHLPLFLEMRPGDGNFCVQGLEHMPWGLVRKDGSLAWLQAWNLEWSWPSEQATQILVRVERPRAKPLGSVKKLLVAHGCLNSFHCNAAETLDAQWWEWNVEDSVYYSVLDGSKPVGCLRPIENTDTYSS